MNTLRTIVTLIVFVASSAASLALAVAFAILSTPSFTSRADCELSLERLTVCSDAADTS